MNKPNNFRIEELVSKDIFINRGDRAWELFTPEILQTLDELRNLFEAPITVNNWLWNGGLHYRGFRPISYYEGKNSLSQHIRGNAVDFDVKGLNAEQAREKIINWKKANQLKKLTAMELGVSWVHVDCRQSDRLNKYGLFLFNS
jgi:hypothetical protein